MDHPSKDWLNPKTGDLFEEKKDSKILNQNFRFNICKDAKELEDCFIWEYNRTREFIGWKYPKKYQKSIKSAFPFSVNQNKNWKGFFPAKPYLSFIEKVSIKSRTWREDQYLPLKKTKKSEIEGSSSSSGGNKVSNKDEKVLLRTKFSSFKGEQFSERSFENLLVPSHQPYEEFPHVSFKVPLDLYINPRWGKTKTVRLFREQWVEIQQKLELNKRELEQSGYIFDLEVDDKESLENSYKKRLKLLGHIRMLYCVGLDFDKLFGTLGGAYAYDEKAIFMKEVRKFQQLDGLMKKIIKHFSR